MKIGGWKTRSVFERYAIVDQRDIASGIGKLELQQQHDRECLGRVEAKSTENAATLPLASPLPN